MDNKIHLIVIQKKEPLGKYETVEVAEMTWDDAIQRTSSILSPTVAVKATGTAISARVSRWGKNDWVYIPQW
jgi:hypothetical protein